MVSQLLTNNLTDPLGVNGETPRLSWQLNASRRGVSQQRYEVHVASSAAGVGDPDVWNSGIVPSARSVDVPYAGPALARRTSDIWSLPLPSNRLGCMGSRAVGY